MVITREAVGVMELESNLYRSISLRFWARRRAFLVPRDACEVVEVEVVDREVAEVPVNIWVISNKIDNKV